MRCGDNCTDFKMRIWSKADLEEMKAEGQKIEEQKIEEQKEDGQKIEGTATGSGK
jgi:hypothetical protein